MNKTKIEWCDKTLNSVCGCTFGCPFCYARKMNKRFGYVENFSQPQFFPERLKQLYSKKPQRIFMDSMSDVADWEYEWSDKVCAAINDNPQHQYIFLSKRPAKYWCNPFAKMGSNVWFGTSICHNAEMEERGGDLYGCGGHGRHPMFLSIEPILENISDFRVELFDWVIIGAETGSRKEKVIPKKEWIDSIVSHCKDANVPIFIKNSLTQIMGENGMLREFPEALQRV